MPMMRKFEKDFVERTIEVIEQYEKRKDDHEVTFLLNCLMGLVSFPIENKKDEKSQLSKDFRKKCVEKFYEIDGEIIIGNDLDVDYFFRKIRNAICHFNIELEENPYGDIANITLWNIYNKKKDFEIKFSVEQLRDFAKFIAEQYLTYYFS